MTKRLRWNSDHHKYKEWEIAEKHLAGRDNGTKLPRSKGLFPKKYVDNNNNKYCIYHSFIIIEGKVIALAGNGRIIGAGAFGKAKLGEDKNGNVYLLKIGEESDIDQHEIEVLSDLHRLKGSVVRTNKHGLKKQYILLEYRGKTLDQFNFHSDRQRLKVALSLVEKVLLLNIGASSARHHRYYHNDIKPENVVLKKNGQLSLIDFGATSRHGQPCPAFTYAYCAPEIADFDQLPSPKSDTYSTGKTLMSFIPRQSRFIHVADLMQADNPRNRPDKAIIIVDFLNALYAHDDKALMRQIQKRKYRIEKPSQARALSALLAASTKAQCFATKEAIATVLSNPKLAKALETAYYYLNSNQFDVLKPHGENGKEQARQYIRNLITLKCYTGDKIQQEMSKWAKGYGFWGRKSNLNDASRIRYISDSNFFATIDPNKSYLEKNKKERQIQLERVISYTS